MTSRGTELLPQNLMDLRKAAGLSLVQIAIATKIRLRYLEAIERGAFQELPGGVYAESYVRQYSQAVGDASNAVLAYYRSVYTQQALQPTAEPEPVWMDRFLDVMRTALGLNPDAPLRARKRHVA